MSQCRSGDQICGAGSNGRRASHGSPTHQRFCVSDCSQRHSLLVVGTVGRQNILVCEKGFAHCRNIAMAENGPDSGKIRMDITVVIDVLIGEIPHQCL